MADDADDATTALIARMLADDQAGYAYDDPYEDASDDSDYGGAKKKTKKQKKGKVLCYTQGISAPEVYLGSTVR